VRPVKRILRVEAHPDTCDLLTFLPGEEGFCLEPRVKKPGRREVRT
jgi:hypothetical protein